MRLRMRSVKNIAQVTRALEAMCASRVRKASRRRWRAGPMPPGLRSLAALALQPGGGGLHPLLDVREAV